MGSLLDEIVAGERPPGDMLPRELDLAEQFEISRGVARESIRALEERGLISVRHGSGATVNERSTWDLFDPDVLSAVIAAEGRLDVLRDHVECRRMPEVEAAAVLPVNPTNERRFHGADLAFHQAIMAATGNRALGILTEKVHSALLVARQPTARPAYSLRRAIPEHRAILEAIEARDSEGAGGAMHAHLDTVLGYLSEGLSERP